MNFHLKIDKNNNEIPKFDKFGIAATLQDYHSLFRFFFDYANCQFSTSCPTAWVSFDTKNGDFINFNFNPEFYKSLDLFNKSFVCSHEMLHIMLEHGIRMKEYITRDKDGKIEQTKENRTNMDLLNKATDIVINEMLKNDFKFDREKITNWKNFCWIDTLFEDVSKVEKNKSFSYYYELLKKGDNLKKPDPNNKGDGQSGGQTVDVHSFGDLTDEEQKQVMDTLGKLAKNLTKEEMDKFFKNKEETDEAKEVNEKLDNMQAGCGAGFWSQLNVGNVKKKKKWETIIKTWENHSLKLIGHDVDRWDRKNRRFSDILDRNNNNCYLPTSVEFEDINWKKDKINVNFYIDTSGSCSGLSERFFRAAKSIDPKYFNVRLFCFDTQVAETTLKSQKIYGGGGTAFDIIEANEQNIVKKENRHYSHAIWILSDGWGNKVIPQYPRRWHWFLTESNSKKYIPKESHIYKLEDYE